MLFLCSYVAIRETREGLWDRPHTATCTAGCTPYLVSANTHREALEKVDRTGAQVYPAVDGWRGHAEARPLTAEELIILRAATGAPRLPPKAVA